MNRIIKFILPKKTFPSDQHTLYVTTYLVSITNSCSTIYDAVDLLKNKKIVYTKREKIQHYGEEIIELRNVLNIHNDSGIKDIAQIGYMVRKIQSGEHIVTAEGIPNVKLVKVNCNQWLLFDGHHSMLAYMHAGNKYLHEVAHLTVENEGVKNVTGDDIMVFFGPNKNKIRGKNW
ncbi:MAG: hypothetical protein ACXACC_10145, partial [Promethearchaeota archaeon]